MLFFNITRRYVDRIIMKINNKLFTLLLFVLLISCNEHIVDNLEDYKGGVCLTFDDAYVDQWYKLSNSLIENNIKATFFVTMINTLASSKLEKLQTLDSLGFEIGCHGYKHIDAVKYLESHTLNDYFYNEVLPALNIMDKSDLHPKSYSYPYGMNNDSLDNYLLNYFEILRDVTDEQRKPLEKEVEKIDEIFCKKGESKIVSSLGIDINFNINESKLRNALQRAKENKEILCVYAHCPVDSNAISYQIEIGYIKNFISLIKEYELNTYTFSELAK